MSAARLIRFFTGLGAAKSDWRKRPSLLDYERLIAIARRECHNYATNTPFPHLVIDDFLEPDILRQVVDAFPSVDDLKWLRRDAMSVTGRVAQAKKFDFALGKKELAEEMELDPLLRYLMLELNSGTFLYFLQALVGIPELIADPKMWGGGLHQTLPGGMLRVHADFLKHPIYRFDRRLNVLLFLNEDWQPEYGGNLELWAPDMSRCVRELAPVANRCVIFTTTDSSYHGYTQPIACPPDMSRKSIAMYYYTIPADAGAPVKPVTYWQNLPTEQGD